LISHSIRVLLPAVSFSHGVFAAYYLLPKNNKISQISREERRLLYIYPPTSCDLQYSNRNIFLLPQFNKKAKPDPQRTGSLPGYQDLIPHGAKNNANVLVDFNYVRLNNLSVYIIALSIYEYNIAAPFFGGGRLRLLAANVSIHAFFRGGLQD
jgi:hypothetical protein